MAGEYNKSHEYDTKAEEAGPVETQAHDMQDRGLFDFLGKKKEEKPQEEGLASEFDEKVKVSESSEPSYVDYSKPAEHGYHSEEHKKEEHKEEEKKHETLSEKLRRSDSSSSSSSDEEGDDEEKKKKRKEKKGLKEKLKEKIAGDKEEEQKKHGYEQDTDEIPVEKFHEAHGQAYDHGPVHHEEPKVEPAAVVYADEEKKEEEKKGFLEKIKDKLPGGHKKPEEGPVASPPPPEYENAEHAHHEGEVKEKKGLLEKIKEKMPGYHPKTEEEKEKEKEKTTGSY